MLTAAMLLTGCEPPVGTQYLGTFQGTGAGFHEIITITGATNPTYTHQFHRDGKLVVNETGKTKITGNELELSPFTRCIDSERGTPLPAPEKFLHDHIWFLGAPPFDMLKPFPEHDYFLQKKSQ